MSDEMSTTDDANPTEGETNAMKEVREAARRNAEKASTLERENAFLKAGVPLDNPVGKLLYDGYDGELEVEAIQGRWTEISSGLSSSEPVPPPADTADGQAEDRTALAGGTPGADLAPEPDKHPFQAGYEAFEERMKTGATRNTAAAEFINRVVDAGVKGDERVIWTGFTEDQIRSGEM